MNKWEKVAELQIVQKIVLQEKKPVNKTGNPVY